MSKYWWLPFILHIFFLALTCAIGMIMIVHNLTWELLWLVPLFIALLGVLVIVTNKIFKIEN